MSVLDRHGLPVEQVWFFFFCCLNRNVAISQLKMITEVVMKCCELGHMKLICAVIQQNEY